MFTNQNLSPPQAVNKNCKICGGVFFFVGKKENLLWFVTLLVYL